MADMKKIIGKLLFPPLLIIILLTVVSGISLVWIFLSDLEENPIAYVIYVLSFYTLSALILFFVKVLPQKYGIIKSKINNSKYLSRYFNDKIFKTHISLYISLGINLLYVGVNLLSYLMYRSVWFIILAVYYVILAVMRFLLLKYVRINEIGKNLSGELRSSALCAYIMLTLNFVLSGAVLMILYQDKGFEYHGVLIYVMAAFTFYITTTAIIDVIKYRNLGSPVMMTSKIIALSSALVSMLALETAMLSRFGTDMSSVTKRIFIASTGAGVSVIVITMSIYMIAKSHKGIKKFKEQNNGKSK